MTKVNAKGSELTRMSLRSLPKNQSFMEEKICCVYGGITMVSFILSF